MKEQRRAGRDIVVIGGSAGSLEPLRWLVSNLPANLPAALFIVTHISAVMSSSLSEILSRSGPLFAAKAQDGEPIQYGRIYLPQADHHLILEKGYVRVVDGPKEQRFRPAINPLFRSAAYNYRSRVIGVILSGCLADGSAGLRVIKEQGGLALVQDPAGTHFCDMPKNALKKVPQTDYVLPFVDIPFALDHLIGSPVPAPPLARFANPVKPYEVHSSNR